MQNPDFLPNTGLLHAHLTLSYLPGIVPDNDPNLTNQRGPRDINQEKELYPWLQVNEPGLIALENRGRRTYTSPPGTTNGPKEPDLSKAEHYVKKSTFSSYNM